MENSVFQNFIHAYHENKLAHAFLIETNDKEKCYHNILEFLKRINCPTTYQDGCKECNLCHLIDTQSLPSIITIYPDGQNIRKEQILDLKKAFQTKPTFSKYNVYIIMGAEFLNSASANTMLKFLEEPEDAILGFFLTNNKENVIETIKSRCQVLLDYYQEPAFIVSDELKEQAISYLQEVLFVKDEALLYNKDVLNPFLKERKDVVLFFQVLLDIYQNYYLASYQQVAIKEEYKNLQVLLKKGPEYLLKQLNLVAQIIDELNYNLNISLVLDRFVLESW